MSKKTRSSSKSHPLARSLHSQTIPHNSPTCKFEYQVTYSCDDHLTGQSDRFRGINSISQWSREVEGEREKKNTRYYAAPAFISTLGPGPLAVSNSETWTGGITIIASSPRGCTSITPVESLFEEGLLRREWSLWMDNFNGQLKQEKLLYSVGAIFMGCGFLGRWYSSGRPVPRSRI